MRDGFGESMHLIMGVEGLKEAQERFYVQCDRHTFGKKPVRLRPILLYGLQFPKEDKPQVMANFKLHGNVKTPDRRAYSFLHPENPFKHGRMQAIICWMVRLFGWPLGLKPPEVPPEKPPYFNFVDIRNLNIYPLAIVEDNAIFNKAHDRKEEWL